MMKRFECSRLNWRGSLAGVLLTLLVFASGCGGAPPTGNVSGTIQWKKQPLERGMIEFLAESDGRSYAAEIANGAFQIELPVGKMKSVRIYGYKKIGERPRYIGDPNSPMEEITKQILPKEWNEESQITLEVVKGEQTFNYGE
ncbi:MAG: hypothetical protein Q4D38_10755 [Planctomycetia bacterium]|nr:hypothetical protein [Planctomycetia bacterium]